jgi:hypothetical protein
MPARRSVAWLVPIGCLLVLALWLVAGCGGDGGEDKGSAGVEESAPPVTGSFVGLAQDEDEATDAFVAIVAASPKERGQEERDVRAYLCDGESITEWFTSRAQGNELDLISEDGALFEGILSAQASTGTITFKDESTLTYTAKLATGLASLYDVTISEEGGVSGTSETGGFLEGQLGEEEQRGEEELRPIRDAFISTEGQEAGFEVLGREPEPEEYRWIVLEDGQVKGAEKRVSGGFLGVHRHSRGLVGRARLEQDDPP